jgi:hypothetical protein
VVVVAAVKVGLLWAQMGSSGPLPDLPPRLQRRLRSPWVFLLHEGVQGFDLRHGGGGHLLRWRWSVNGG